MICANAAFVYLSCRRAIQKFCVGVCRISGTPLLKQNSLQQATHLRWIARDSDTAFFHDRQLGRRCVGATGNQRPGMAHAFTWRRSYTSDETNHRLLHIVLDPVRSIGFVRTADFTDHDHCIGVRIIIERLHDVDMLQTVDRVTADADRGRLAQAQRGQLRDCLVGQRAGTGYHADAAFFMDVARHDANLDFVRCDQTRAVGTQQQCLAAGLGHAVLQHQHVAHRNAFRDTDDQIQSGFDSFPDSSSCARRRHIDHRNIGAGCLPGLGNMRENGNAFEFFISFFRVHAGNEGVPTVRILPAHTCVELTGFTGDTLGNDFSVPIDQNRHGSSLSCYLPLAAATTFRAASSMLSAEMIDRPESANNFLPISSLVPFMRTTSGTFRETALDAAMTPSAITSQRMMPPKMLTRMAFNPGFLIINANASVTCSVVAPPPTSRKLAGSPPNSLMLSMVAMARPAPLTRQPILPSREM